MQVVGDLIQVAGKPCELSIGLAVYFRDRRRSRRYLSAQRSCADEFRQLKASCVGEVAQLLVLTRREPNRQLDFPFLLHIHLQIKTEGRLLPRSRRARGKLQSSAEPSIA